MSDSTSLPPPDELPTVKLPGAADLARGPLVAGPFPQDEPSREWANWTFPEPAELAAQLNGYDVDRILGRGGMGAVYHGRQLALERPVAIKVLPLELSTDPDFAARFHREARAMARLDHPNIVKVIEFGKTSGGLLYFTMDYVDGGDVSKLLKEEGPLPAPRAAALMLEVCAALECAHRSGTIHRDIKPANILLTADGQAKVADFGLVRMTGGESELGTTRLGVVMGTPEYMAPEQRDGLTTEPASDVYSAGVVLYQLLTGRLPQGAWELPSVVCRQRGAEADEGLDTIIAIALQENPIARFADAGAMRAAIEPLVPSSRHRGSIGAAPSWWMMVSAGLLLAGAAWLLPRMPLWRGIDDRVKAAAISLAAPVNPSALERVVLLDISRLEVEDRVDAAGSRTVTPRNKLLALVHGIATERPQAIAIDIDFGPETTSPDDPYTPDDPEFFRALLQLRQETGVPVFVGVHRQASAGRNGWLAGAEFAPLATGIGIAADADDVVRRLPWELIAHKDGASLPSLSTALARAGGAADPMRGQFAAMGSRLSDPVETGTMSVPEYTPNFASLDRLAWQRVSGTDPRDVPGLRQRLGRNLVVLSDAELGSRDGEDTFIVPGRRTSPVPGAYIHAAGVVTLLSGAPAILTRAGRILGAVIFVGLLAAGFWIVERRIRNRRGRVDYASAKRAGRCAVMGSVALLAFLFMRSWRVAWPDVLYLSVALLLLRPLAGALDAAARRIFTGRRKHLYPVAHK